MANIIPSMDAWMDGVPAIAATAMQTTSLRFMYGAIDVVRRARHNLARTLLSLDHATQGRHLHGPFYRRDQADEAVWRLEVRDAAKVAGRDPDQIRIVAETHCRDQRLVTRPRRSLGWALERATSKLLGQMPKTGL